jgi:hypothetical protein
VLKANLKYPVVDCRNAPPLREASKLSGTLIPMAARRSYYTAPEGWHLGLPTGGGFHAGKSASEPPM